MKMETLTEVQEKKSTASKVHLQWIRLTCKVGKNWGSMIYPMKALYKRPVVLSIHHLGSVVHLTTLNLMLINIINMTPIIKEQEIQTEIFLLTFKVYMLQLILKVKADLWKLSLALLFARANLWRLKTFKIRWVRLSLVASGSQLKNR